MLIISGRIKMYDIFKQVLEPNQIAVAGILAAFVLTFAGLAFPFSFPAC